MSRILVCGLCPLPFENTKKNFGPGIRSWQFAWSLSRAGHDVRLLAVRIPGVYEGNEAPDHEIHDGIEIHRLSDAELLEPRSVATHLKEFSPDAVVGATIYGSHMLTLSKPQVPFWADNFGHVMAEAQAKASLEGANWPLAHFWKMQQPVLRAADVYSVVSERQRYAVIGELGTVGRLTAENCGYEFVHSIPCGLVPEREHQHKKLIRGRLTPENAFVVLWSGGYNVWSDVRTLFLGLERAMRESERVHFVSTGGEIGGYDTKSYDSFKEMIAQSPFSERFHLEGWVDAEDVPSYYDDADLGILTDIPIYEGMLGSKNRIVQWMGVGIPVVYNLVGDIGEMLAREKVGLTFHVGHDEGLGQQILWAARNPEELGRITTRATEYARRHLSFEATTRPLLQWAERPLRSPDSDHRERVNSPADHANLKQLIVNKAQEVPALRRSSLVRRTWRWLFGTIAKKA